MEPQFRTGTRVFRSHDNERMVFYTLGLPTAPAVLLLHGYSGSSLTQWWDRGIATQIAAAGYYAVGLDLRGHGASARPESAGSYTEGQELRDIVSLADHLGLSRYAAVGYSHGAIETAKLLTVDPRVACGVIGGMGDLLADAAWRQSYGIGTIAAALEGRARGEPLAGVPLQRWLCRRRSRPMRALASKMNLS